MKSVSHQIVKPNYRSEVIDRSLQEAYVGKWLYWWFIASLLSGGLFAHYSEIKRDVSFWHHYNVWGGLILALIVTGVRWQHLKEFEPSSAIVRRGTIVIFILCCMGFPFMLQFINCRLDMSQPQIYKVKLLKKWIESGKSKSYWFETRDYADVHRTVAFWTYSQPYESHKIGDDVTIRVKKGFLKREWIQDAK